MKNIMYLKIVWNILWKNHVFENIMESIMENIMYLKVLWKISCTCI